MFVTYSLKSHQKIPLFAQKRYLLMNFSNMETKRYPAHQFFYYRDHRGIFFHVFASIETTVVSFSCFYFYRNHHGILFHVFSSIRDHAISYIIFLPIETMSLAFQLLKLLGKCLPVFHIRHDFFLERIDFALNLCQLGIAGLIFRPQQFLF